MMLDECPIKITTIEKFTEDTKTAYTIRNEQDRMKLQQCLDKLVKWADEWDYGTSSLT